jgi:hypothetical protein
VADQRRLLKGILNRAKRKAGIKPKADKPPVNDESADA